MRRENVRRMKKKKEMRKRFLSVISTTKNKITKLIKKKYQPILALESRH